MSFSSRMTVRFCPPQERYAKARELAALIDTWGGEQAVLTQLRKLLQVASALTFAVRARSFNKAERASLQKHARDTVSCGFEPDFSSVFIRERWGDDKPSIHLLRCTSHKNQGAIGFLSDPSFSTQQPG